MPFHASRPQTAILSIRPSEMRVPVWGGGYRGVQHSPVFCSYNRCHSRLMTLTWLYFPVGSGRVSASQAPLSLFKIPTSLLSSSPHYSQEDTEALVTPLMLPPQRLCIQTLLHSCLRWSRRLRWTPPNPFPSSKLILPRGTH